MKPDPSLIELVRRWEVLREEGQDQSAAELCAAEPGLAEELRRRALEALPATLSVAGLSAEGGADGTRRTTAVPGYEILSELGHGGMGVVYRARQVRLNRDVALKMILAGEHASDEERARFLKEAEAVARVVHPNVVQIFDVGEQDGRPYLAMELVQGQSLADRLVGGPLPVREAAELVRVLADAVQAAHGCDVVHRDLKPGNVLLAQPETQGGGAGSPKVTDFGLAKRLDVPESLTQTGAVLGTPGYLAPEQAQGKAVGPAADVYALGAILYECLTGRPPFRAATPVETILQTLEHEPVSPRLLNPAVEHDLETICLKCLEKEPERRYPSARELTLELARFLAGEPIRARSVRVLEELARALQQSMAPGVVDPIAWGNVLLGFAPIALAFHALVFLLAGYPDLLSRWGTPARIGQFLAMAGVYWAGRRGRLRPRTPLEREMLSVTVGYIVSCLLIQQAVHRTLAAGTGELVLYPLWSVLSGLAFFILGTSLWGRCYLFAAAFFAASLLMPLALSWSPLLYGVLWGAILLGSGLYLRGRGVEESQREPQSGRVQETSAEVR